MSTRPIDRRSLYRAKPESYAALVDRFRDQYVDGVEPYAIHVTTGNRFKSNAKLIVPDATEVMTFIVGLPTGETRLVAELLSQLGLDCDISADSARSLDEAASFDGIVRSYWPRGATEDVGDLETVVRALRKYMEQYRHRFRIVESPCAPALLANPSVIDLPFQIIEIERSLEDAIGVAEQAHTEKGMPTTQVAQWVACVWSMKASIREQRTPILSIRFENLIDDPVSEVRSLASVFDVTDQNVISNATEWVSTAVGTMPQRFGMACPDNGKRGPERTVRPIRKQATA